MPNTIYIPEDAKHSGIDITWYKTTGEICIGGWYDSFVGIGSERMSLADFLFRLGVERKHIKRLLEDERFK